MNSSLIPSAKHFRNDTTILYHNMVKYKHTPDLRLKQKQAFRKVPWIIYVLDGK
jgi:hypothetical protein